MFEKDDKNQFEIELIYQFNNPKNIKLISNIENNSYSFIDLDNNFSVFNSINNILFLVYTTYNNSIIFYDSKNY